MQFIFLLLNCAYFITSGEAESLSTDVNVNVDNLLFSESESCANSEFCQEKRNTRYFLYDVNPGEGFNLRRDIYIRIAPLIQKLNELDTVSKWILVLPPWGRLPHWWNQKNYFPWSTYFRLDRIQSYIPALELSQYLEDYGFDNAIDMIFQLQHFQFDPDDRAWTEKIEIGVPCEETFPYTWNPKELQFSRKIWTEQIFSRNATCMSLRGQASTLTKFLIESPYRSVIFDRAEVILWDTYGGSEWWKARKSLQFSLNLVTHAESYLTKTVPSFQLAKILETSQFLAVHLRRQDFVLGRRLIPSIQGAVFQLIQLLKRLKLNYIFLASDASAEEFKEFLMEVKLLSEDMELNIKILSFSTDTESVGLSEGEIAVIDQIICSWSAFFIGTPDSTFTLRIFEEREILGFESDLTFNYLCPDQSEDDEEAVECKQPTKWKLI